MEKAKGWLVAELARIRINEIMVVRTPSGEEFEARKVGRDGFDLSVVRVDEEGVEDDEVLVVTARDSGTFGGQPLVVAERIRYATPFDAERADARQ